MSKGKKVRGNSKFLDWFESVEVQDHAVMTLVSCPCLGFGVIYSNRFSSARNIHISGFNLDYFCGCHRNLLTHREYTVIITDAGLWC